MVKEMFNFVYEVSLSYMWGSLTCRKIYRHVLDVYTSPPKEAAKRTFTALKNLIVLGHV
jgi:predicted heme/steroid binding protein